MYGRVQFSTPIGRPASGVARGLADISSASTCSVEAEEFDDFDELTFGSKGRTLFAPITLFALPEQLDGSMDFVDRELTCFQCSSTFVFSAAEQQFFKEKGFANAPKRCKRCRAKVDGHQRIEACVTCAGCGIATTVPFKPRGTRPVFCSVCFEKQSEQPQRGISQVKPVSRTE
jgi:CxxC-x17-CxxC domain-containing protein